MPNLMPKEIVEDVRRVLADAAADKDKSPYLTAFQILARLPEPVRTRIIAERGPGGKDAGAYYTASNVVSDAADMVLGGAPVVWLDTGELMVLSGGQLVEFGAGVCRLYRLSV